MKIKFFATNGMRSTALALCALTVSSASAWALAAQTQDAPPPQSDGSAPPDHARMEHMQEHHLEMLTRRLSLTPDQVTQIKGIDEDTRTQVTALRQDASTAKSDKHEKMKAIHEEQTAKIRAVLTEEQKPKFDQMIAHEKEHAGHHRGPGGDQAPPPPPAA